MIFSGCSTVNKGAEKIQPPDKFNDCFVSGDFEGTISFDYMDKTELVFSKPDSLKGLVLTLENNKITSKYADMFFSSDVTQTSIIYTLNNVISDIILNNQSLSATEENGLLKRTGKEYTAYQNKESGLITKIICGKHEIRFIQK